MTQEISFDNGAAYERYMGVWSQLAGEQFLDWLHPADGLRWLDVGCGNGAFTEMIVERCAPSAVHGVDPSDAQIGFAQERPTTHMAEFKVGDAMALPFADDTFDAAVMPLVIFFVPEPARGVAEMARVVAPGGIVSAYGWDLLGGGFPYTTLWDEMRALELHVPMPPSPDAARIETLRQLWTEAGMASVETREIIAERTFANFDEYWATILMGPSVAPSLAALDADGMTRLMDRMRARLTADAGERLTCTARANAITGRVPPTRGKTEREIAVAQK